MKKTFGKLTIEINISWEKTYLREIKDLLRKGQKLMAIKVYKEATGKGLKESKEFVDALCPKYYNSQTL